MLVPSRVGNIFGDNVESTLTLPPKKCHLKRDYFKRKIVFQTSIFPGDMLVFGGVTLPTKQGEMGTSDKEIGEFELSKKIPKCLFISDSRIISAFPDVVSCLKLTWPRKIGVEGGQLWRTMGGQL